MLCPGFIDVHSHSDLPLLSNPRSEPKIRQGITTELLGADGLSYAPLSPTLLAEVKYYLAGLYGNPDVDIVSESVAGFTRQFDRQSATNTLYVVPHQALRLMACGWRAGPPTDAELSQMLDLLEQGLSEGAFGLGTGLDYFPHGTCTTDELVALGEVVARHAGVLVAHIRYALGAVEAVREMVEISERCGVRVLVSHMRNAEALPVIDAARARGVDDSVRHLPVQRRLQHVLDVPAVLGARRRPRALAGAAARSGCARATARRAAGTLQR